MSISRCKVNDVDVDEDFLLSLDLSIVERVFSPIDWQQYNYQLGSSRYTLRSFAWYRELRTCNEPARPSSPI